MTRRDDILKTWRGGQCDRVPLWELEFHLYGRYAGKGLTLGHEFAALDDAGKEVALQRNAETIVEVAERLGFYAVSNPNNYWEIAPGHAAFYWLPGEYVRRQLAALRKAAGNRLALVSFGSATISPPIGDAYEQFCFQIFDEPEVVEANAEKVLQAGLEMARKARDLGADAICNACDIADNHGVFFPPAQMDRLWWPFFHRWNDAVHEMGMVTILHSDGQLTPLLETLAASELDALQAVDPIAGMDIEAVKRTVGNRLCLCGNIDCGLLQFGPAQKVESHTRKVIQSAKPGGAFVLGGSNAIFDEVPLEHYDAMLSAWRQDGAY